MESYPHLLCTVRDCHLRLCREAHRLKCTRGHSFDIAASGYINLLAPQDRRSRNPGDTRAAVAARRNLHDEGVTRPLLEAISQVLRATASDTVLDIGSGDGFYLAGVARQTRCRAYGVDLSVAAVDLAARRYPTCEWIVANADRFVPYSDGSFSIVLSITARMNPGEFHRVLRPGGKLLVALPAPDDLIEIRGVGRDDRAPRTIMAFSEHFELLTRRRATAKAALSASSLENILHSIYRPMQPKLPAAMEVTFSLDVLLFEAKA